MTMVAPIDEVDYTLKQQTGMLPPFFCWIVVSSWASSIVRGVVQV